MMHEETKRILKTIALIFLGFCLGRSYVPQKQANLQARFEQCVKVTNSCDDLLQKASAMIKDCRVDAASNPKWLP